MNNLYIFCVAWTKEGLGWYRSESCWFLQRSKAVCSVKSALLDLWKAVSSAPVVRFDAKFHGSYKRHIIRPQIAFTDSGVFRWPSIEALQLMNSVVLAGGSVYLFKRVTAVPSALLVLLLWALGCLPDAVWVKRVFPRCALKCIRLHSHLLMYTYHAFTL